MINSKAFAEVIAPFRHVTSTTALSERYKAIEIRPDGFKAVASHGALEVLYETGINQTIHVNTSTLLMLAKMLPEEGSLTWKANNKTLEWRCGSVAHGRLAAIALPEAFPDIADHDGARFHISDETKIAFDLGAISCTNSISQEGRYGVVISPYDDGGIVCSTDGVTVSVSSMGVAPLHALGWPVRLTLAAPSAALLSTIMEPGGTLNYHEADGLTYYHEADGKTTRCQVKPIKPLMVDIPELYEQYTRDKPVLVAPLREDRVKAFLRYTAGIAESNRNARVVMQHDGSTITLLFKGDGVVETSEHFLVENLAQFDLQPCSIILSAEKLGRVLSHTNTIILDHMDKPALMLAGDHMTYLISGSSG